MRRGFTLIELVVSMALTALIGLMAYALFGISADNLVEVDSLEVTASKGRFTIEKLRNVFQIAGSFSSPDSILDPFVQPRTPTPSYHVAGFHSYPGWQDSTSLAQDVSFDGIIITGAFDYPTSFDVGGFVIGAATAMNIPGNFLGMEKLNRVNPFSDVVRHPSGNYLPDLEKQDWDVIDSYRFLERDFSTRLIRVTDNLGYVQFVKSNFVNSTFSSSDIEDLNNGTSSRTLNGLNIPLSPNAPFQVKYKDPGAGLNPDGLDLREIGLNPAASGEGDRTYEASFIDSYWLHIINPFDPRDPTNRLLVMERLCADAVATDNPGLAPASPGNATPIAAGCGTNSRKMIADHVVDFQVWFDCVPSGGGELAMNTNWTRQWITPDNTTGGGSCMNPGPGYAPGRARVAHARITLRTSEERATLFSGDPSSDVSFSSGDTPCTLSSNCPNASLRSFDPFPNLRGETPVITFQTDLALRNFIIKDLQ